jgi:hypothetical protein
MVVSPLVEFHCRLHPLPTRSSSARRLIGWRIATHETRFCTAPSHRSGLRSSRNCRVGGGASDFDAGLPSAAQTVHAVSPHTAFTKTHSFGMQLKGFIEQGLAAHTLPRDFFLGYRLGGRDEMAAFLQDEERSLLRIATDQVEDHVDLLSQNLLELLFSIVDDSAGSDGLHVRLTVTACRGRTVAPAWDANCTAWAPTAPAPPWIRIVCPFSR